MAAAKRKSAIKQDSSNRSKIASQSDDRRRVNDWPVARILLLVRGSIVWIFLFAWFLAEIENLGILNFGVTTGFVPFHTLVGGFALALGAATLIPILNKRYREQDFEPDDWIPVRLTRCRQESNKALDEGGFRKVGTFRIHGAVSPARCEVYLGCQQMVIALFASRDGTIAIELVSITESGRVITTRSVATNGDEPAQDDRDDIVVMTATESSFEKMLAIHLRTLTDASGETDSQIAELTESDTVDVLRYYNRARHNMLVKRGLARGKVGPMTYGRFRFPLGIVS